MRLNDFINQLETFLPNIHAQLEVKLVGSDLPCRIWVAAGENKVTFYIEQLKNHNNENTHT